MPIARSYLIDYMHRQNISITILATRAEVSERHIYNIIHKRNMPNVELADKLANILKCSINDLFEFSYEKKLL